MKDVDVMHRTTQVCHWKDRRVPFYRKLCIHTHTHTHLSLQYPRSNEEKCTYALQPHLHLNSKVGVLNGLSACFLNVLQLSLINKQTKKDSTTQLLFTPCNTRPLITNRSAEKGKEARSCHEKSVCGSEARVPISCHLSYTDFTTLLWTSEAKDFTSWQEHRLSNPPRRLLNGCCGSWSVSSSVHLASFSFVRVTGGSTENAISTN